MIVFFLVISAVLFLSSYYVYSRGMIALQGSGYTRIFGWIFWILVATFLMGQIMERGEPSVAGRIVTWTGSLWLSVFLHLFLFVVVVDAGRAIHHFLPFFPARLIAGISNGYLFFFTAIVLAAGISVYGFINARNPQITRLTIHSAKNPPGISQLKIVMVSDVHIGAMTGNQRVEKMIDDIIRLKPDLVIFAGDLVDHNPRFLVSGDIGKHFLRLAPPMGIYAIAGNHEFIGHAEVSIGYMSQHGVKYVRDTVIDLSNGILLAGRDDRDKIRFTGSPRKELGVIMEGVDREKFIILADHQPVEYEAVQQAGIDLMLSGHTHKGQLWPFNFITSAVYPNDYGLVQKGNTFYYTSSGYGTWGPPVRTANRPEMVEITVVFDKNITK